MNIAHSTPPNARLGSNCIVLQNGGEVVDYLQIITSALCSPPTCNSRLLPLKQKHVERFLFSHSKVH